MNYNFRKCLLLTIMVLSTVAGCSDNLDFDMRDQFGGRLDTSSAANGAVANRPDPDERGVITFPNYQVIVARDGDRISDLAERINADAAVLGRYNGVSQVAILRHGEIIALPTTVVATLATGKFLEPTVVDISELSDDISSTSQSNIVEPKRHRVIEGETAFTIARLYNVSANDLTVWNSLGTEKNVRVGQYLLIPPTDYKTTAVNVPGQASAPPSPPSSTQPQPQEVTLQPALSSTQALVIDTGSVTAASSIETRFVRPVSGNIIRSYKKGKNDGIDIGAKPGSIVSAADDGTVAAITKDTNGVSILVIKHVDGLLTVYTNIDKLGVKKGDWVKRGQKIAAVRAGTPSFLHFEVRRGLVSVDPDDYI